jgi:alpha-glucosidase
MQWNDHALAGFAGFSKVHPWFSVNPNYTDINAEQQDPNFI